MTSPELLGGFRPFQKKALERCHSQKRNEKDKAKEISKQRISLLAPQLTFLILFVLLEPDGEWFESNQQGTIKYGFPEQWLHLGLTPVMILDLKALEGLHESHQKK